jgi:hypothetical protein
MIRTILLDGGPMRRFLKPLVDHRTFQLLKSLLMPQLWQVLGRSGHEIPEVTTQLKNSWRNKPNQVSMRKGVPGCGALNA